MLNKLGYSNIPRRTAPFVNRLFNQEVGLMYVAFGDSHTHGARTEGFLTGAPKPTWKSFSNLMRDYLQSINPTTQYVNSGIGGNNTTQMLNRIESDVLQHNPDLVIWGSAINDAHDHFSLALFESNCRSIIQQILDSGSSLLVFSETPVCTVSFDWGFNGGNLKPDSERTIDYVARLGQIARDMDVAYIDTYDLFASMLKNGLPGDSFFDDRAHPHNFGHHLYFEFLRKGVFGTKSI